MYKEVQHTQIGDPNGLCYPVELGIGRVGCVDEDGGLG